MLFYNIMIWIILGLIVSVVAICIIFVVIYCLRNTKLKKEVHSIWGEIMKIAKQQEYDRELFDLHFKTTDETILDTRREREYWKQKALSLEKSVKIKE